MEAKALAATALLLALPLLAGCLGSGSAFVVVASAPVVSNGLTVLVANAGSVLGPVDGRASFVVRYAGEVVYPPGGVQGAIDLRAGKGSAFVPYNYFVLGNGDYEVEVSFGGSTERHTVAIEKWVNYVFLQAYCDQSKRCAYAPSKNLKIDAVLEHTAGLTGDRVVAKGTLNVDLRYHGEAKDRNAYAYGFSTDVPGESTFVRVEVPLAKFATRTGWYSVETTFHNEQALGNTWVGNDPAMARTEPPANWVWIDR